MEDHESPGPTFPLRRAMMVAWKAECFRSAATAHLFGTVPTFVWPSSRVGIARRYLLSFYHTFHLVLRERPNTVIVLNQPPFLVIAVLLARLFNRHVLILDFHSGVLTKPSWRPFLPLYRWVVRRSPFVLSHNDVDTAEMVRWGGRPLRLLAIPRRFPGLRAAPPGKRPTILVVCSFAPDEPIDVLMKAMGQCPEIRFEVTGRASKAGLTADSVPSNVSLLGFVPYDQYLEHMAVSTAVATFSTRPHIMQMAVEEAMNLGVPVVTNRSPTLQEVLGGAGVFCDLTVEAMRVAFRTAAADADNLRAQAGTLFDQRAAAVTAEVSTFVQSNPDLFVPAR